MVLRRSKMNPPIQHTSGKDLMIYIGAALLVFPLISGVYYLSDQCHPTASARPIVPAIIEKPVTTESGSVGPYKYTLLKREGEGIAAVFQPLLLPRNDGLMIAATQIVIKQGF